MQQSGAINLTKKGISSEKPQRWADLGCETGTFTMALSNILLSGSHIIAIDKQDQDLSVEFIKADFAKDNLLLSDLDGILIANSIHYIRDKQKIIKNLEKCFYANPTFLIVEYDTSRFNPWVPYPINFEKLKKLFSQMGYTSITKWLKFHPGSAANCILP
ncbi:class I SAM-dependent methyltransferase [Mucilaginibacter sp.]